MKKIVLILFLTQVAYAQDILESAPTEWLIAHTMQLKLSESEHLEDDKLIHEIFNTVEYLEDELIINKSSVKLHDLQTNLLSYIRNKQNNNQDSALYEKFTGHENEKNIKKVLYRTNFAPKGHYYFNHVHTKISQDNSSLKWLKISPTKTFKLLDKFLKRRSSSGSVALTDHDTDIAYEEVLPLKSERLHPLRSVEWGGKTHMCLIDIIKDWDHLSLGRDFTDEDSIIMSRTSEGARIVNHPNARYNFPYQSWLDADAVEVWNTPYENSPFLWLNIERSHNLEAFLQWKNALKENRNYTAIAGSDFHFKIPCLTERMLVYPVNFIPETDITKTKEYIKKGNLSFLTRPTAPKLTLLGKFSHQKNWANMGDEIEGRGHLQIQIFGDFSDVKKRIGGTCYNIVNNFYRLLTFWKKRYWQLRVYNKQGKIIAKQAINPKKFGPKKHFKLELEILINQNDAIRAELWEINRKSKSVDLLGATNALKVF